LYEVPEDYDNVIFDLSWGYPNSGIDFLDASVFLFKGSKFIELVDYKQRVSKNKAVKHSGDLRDDDNRLGHHTIDISIKSLPSHIDHLVFTLSAFTRPNISKYRNLSLRFYDARCPNKQLCDDRMDEVANSKAVIMCFLIKRDKKWRVVGAKRPCDGNAIDYGPLKETIEKLIGDGKRVKSSGCILM
jgi:stress response protein SCP2